MGTISWEGFVRGFKHILSVSEAIDDGWRLHGSLDERNGAYLGKKVAITGRETSSLGTPSVRHPISTDENTPTEDGAEEDPARLDIDPDAGAVFAEFHVVYSEPYAVPTLFFTSWRPDGSAVPIEDVWREFTSKQSLELETGELLRTITQQEHPFLGEPWYLLHPCRTSELMSSITGGDDANRHALTDDELYAVRWLSTVAPLVGCPLAFSYAKTRVATAPVASE